MWAACVHPGAGRATPAPPAAPFPDRLQALQSVVIRVHGRPIAALGWLRLDRPEGRYALTGLTPAGMTLFTLSETGTVAEAAFAFPVGGEQAAWGEAMASDVRRIFLASAPRSGDRAAWHRGRWRAERSAGGRREAEFEYRRADGRLSEARWYEDGRRVGATEFADYRPAGGGAIPFLVRHRNDRFGYVLELRMREIQHAETGDGG